MRTFLRTWAILGLIGLSRASEVSVLTPGNFGTFEEEEILRMLARNKTDTTKNYTFVELISSLGNYTLDTDKDIWSIGRPEVHHTNPHYEVFSEKIDFEARRLLQILPAYDPGAGRVSAECKRHSDIFHQELAKFTLWALKMYDATAKVPSGLLSGNVNQFGDFDECVGVEGKDGIRGQYCLAYLKLDVDQSRPDLKYLHRLLHSHYAFRSNLTDEGHRVPRFNTINWAVCTPASCTAEDVKNSLQHAIAKYTAQTGFKITLQVEESMCQVKEEFVLPKAGIVISLLIATVFVLTLVGAYYDHHRIPASELLLSFSLKRNLQKLMSLKRPQGDIASLHGIRFLNSIMLIVSHKSMAVFYDPYINRTYMTELSGKPWTVIARAASLYTDPFIMMSGLLTAYSFIGRLQRSGSLNIRNEYFSRLMRLVPTLGALVLFCTHVLPYVSSGPQWNLVVSHHANICKKTWWRNFLFIHNYFGFENMCLTHTHHVGIDMQLFAVSPLMVLLLYKRPKIGALVLVIVASISTIMRFYAMYTRHLNNYIYFGTSIRELFDTANYSYTLPSHRLTVYIIGIFMGYLLRNLPKDFKMSSTTLYAGWTVSTVLVVMIFAWASKMGLIDYVYNPIDAAIYNAFAPIGWCTFFLWVIVTQHTGNSNGFLSRFFSWRGFLITTRLSYAVYLTQFPIFFFNVGRTRAAMEYDIIGYIVNFKEILWIVIMSMILTLLFDTPFQNIKNHLLRKPVQKNVETKSSKVE
ncbi:O-acyltransferase like protein [Harpegnathos saltator]|uniref:Nose resistant to fluoxetine protein 6 n=1 Tax=Harpegnathos saltator TaxID=610380 RepID=E2B332_HARSA|nr:O-acyltransferase like protein [Harpegnathos saltator]EFN89881.1 Nose resistant to fluoxetine protein 6 [Harpegnathos saltator]